MLLCRQLRLRCTAIRTCSGKHKLQRNQSFLCKANNRPVSYHRTPLWRHQQLLSTSKYNDTNNSVVSVKNGVRQCSHSTANKTKRNSLPDPTFKFGDLFSLHGHEYHHSILVPVIVKELPGCGRGVIAATDLPSGTLLFREKDVVEVEFTSVEADQLLRSTPQKEVRKIILQHCWCREDKGDDGVFIWTKDSCSFFNHSFEPNFVAKNGMPGGVDTIWVTSRPISKGEELVCDYEILFPDDPPWFDELHVKFLGHTQWVP